MRSEVDKGSFRDPSGFVFFRDGAPHRQVNEAYAEDWEALTSSGALDALVAEGVLVPHEDLGPGDAPEPGALTVIRPRPVAPITYPYEWCFSQMKDAALATLRAQEIALDHGMTLRDASAYNVQFLDGRATLIDTLSFGRRTEGEPWVAYRQFCMHFLAPLALMAHVDVRLSGLLRAHLDGIPLDLATRLLPRRTRMRPSFALHLGLHARSQRRHADDDVEERSATTRGASVSERGLRGLVESLRAAVRRLDWEPGASTWSAYYTEGDSYSPAGLEHKRRLVAECLDEIAPATVWDLGANTGMYSRLAADRGAQVVAFDSDVSCIESAYRTLRDEGETRILPLVTDLANPAPALGWHHAERASLVDRGPVDVALALALVHHLAIGNNVPLPRVADFLADLCNDLVIEFVPKSDPKVRLLLASREDVFGDYTLDGFEKAFADRFSPVRSEQITDSDRVLHHLRRR